MSSSRTPAARLLAGAIEPVAGQAQFAPECHARYAELGFDPSPGRVGRTEVPDRSAYFSARGSILGQVPGQVVAATFAVFNPDVVVPLVERGWTLTDAATLWAARHEGAVAQLRRILGPDPDDAGTTADLLLAAAEQLPLSGRPLFAAEWSHPAPADPLGRLWRATDTLREYRGDSHILVWAAAGFDAVEIGLLSDLYWGLAPRAHTGGRGWSDDELAAGEDRLRSRGLLEGDRLSPAGAEQRDQIERRTDDAIGPALDHLGDRLGDVLRVLAPWGDAIRAAGGYLTPAVRFTHPGEP